MEKLTEKTWRTHLLPGSLKSREQKPWGVSVWSRTMQHILGSLMRGCCFPETRENEETGCLGKRGVCKPPELTRVHRSRPKKDYFSLIPLGHRVPPLDSGHLLHSLR